jgi:mannose-6-phosphate isomerase-like protein (cupin superfamily)
MLMHLGPAWVNADCEYHNIGGFMGARRTGVIALYMTLAAGAQVSAQSATVVQPWEGERLAFCDSPELSVVLKVDSARTGARQFSMGTGELAPKTSNASRGHRTDEIVYFTRGMGTAVLGRDTVPVHRGTTLYIPLGLPHAFTNPTDVPMEFVWFVAPRGFEEGLRAAGVPSHSMCPPAHQGPGGS